MELRTFFWMGKIFGKNFVWGCTRHWRPCDVEPRKQEEAWNSRYLPQCRGSSSSSVVGGRVFLLRGGGSSLQPLSTGSSQLRKPRLQHFEVKWLSGLCKVVPDRWSKQKHTSTRGQLSSVSLSPFTMCKLEANEIVTTAGNKWGTAHERPWGHHVSWHSWSTCKPVISS